MYRPSRLKDIERSKEALISHYSSLVPSSLQELSPEERRRVYRMMHLRVSAHRDDTLIADWGCNDEPLPPWSFRFTTPAFRFRAVLTGDGSEEVELTKA
jgi:hypothetical protein